jgi:hypothetical protein
MGEGEIATLARAVERDLHPGPLRELIVALRGSLDRTTP